jgi:phosphatidylglycerophosphatase A
MAGAAARELGLPLRHPAALVATWFGSGLLPGAPGTWGSLAALPAAWAAATLMGSAGLVAAAAALLALGGWASHIVARASGTKDAGAIVVDEVVGQWLTLGLAGAAAPFDPLAYAAGFAFFRLCDIVKPWPASWADRRLKGGIGIMADDVVAGFYAALLLALGRHILDR